MLLSFCTPYKANITTGFFCHFPIIKRPLNIVFYKKKRSLVFSLFSSLQKFVTVQALLDDVLFSLILIEHLYISFVFLFIKNIVRHEKKKTKFVKWCVWLAGWCLIHPSTRLGCSSVGRPSFYSINFSPSFLFASHFLHSETTTTMRRRFTFLA